MPERRQNSPRLNDYILDDNHSKALNRELPSLEILGVPVQGTKRKKSQVDTNISETSKQAGFHRDGKSTARCRLIKNLILVSAGTRFYRE